MPNYFKHKLRSKLDIIAKSKGLSPYEINNIDYDKLEFGFYEIVWKSFLIEDQYVDKVISLRKLNDSTSKVEFGKYFIDGRSFASSQVIYFDLREFRENKLNELLK